MNGRFSRKYIITAQDMDPDYHMTLPAILLYSQDAMAAFFTKYNIAAFDVIKDNKIWVFTDYHIECGPRRAYWQDEIKVEAWMSELSGLKVYTDFQITGPDGVEVAHGDICWTALDIESRRPVSVADIINGSGLELDPAAYKHPRSVFPPEGIKIAEYSHVTNATDIDQNGHVNNRTYLDAAMSGASIDMLKSHQPSSVRLKFIHETFVGDTLKCEYFKPDEGTAADSCILTKIFDQNGLEVCRISSDWVPAVQQEPIADHIVRD